MIDQKFFVHHCASYDIHITEEAYLAFEKYAEEIIRVNQIMNLTTIVKPQEMVIKHFIDSLLLWSVYHPKKGAKVLDIGAGAGFPSIPLAIMRKDLIYTQLDSQKKRIEFLTSVAQKLELPITAFHGRAETMAHESEHRESYDLVVARAVAPLPRLAEYALGYVKEGGIFCAYKTPSTEELCLAASAIDQMGGKIKETDDFTLPDGAQRRLILIQKQSVTPKRFPRTQGKIKKVSL